MANKPERTCIVCRQKNTKDEFIKVVKNKLGEYKIQKENYLDGRGAYVCKNKQCIEKCIKTRALNRVFKTNVPNEIYEELIDEQ